jgi:hypothetical protein
MKASSGAALRLLSIPLALWLLTSCGQQPSPPSPVKTAQGEVDEVDALIAATKQHPSLLNPSKSAGRPIHVDPVPSSTGMPHHAHSAK